MQEVPIKEESEKEEVRRYEIDGIEVVEYSDGSAMLTESEESKRKEIDKLLGDEELSWFERAVNWFRKHDATPYVETIDLADPTGKRAEDPFDVDAGEDGVNAITAGIKIRF